MDESQLCTHSNVNSKTINTNNKSWYQFLFQSSFLPSQGFMAFFLVLAVLFYGVAQNYQGTEEARYSGDQNHGQPDESLIIISYFGRFFVESLGVSYYEDGDSAWKFIKKRVDSENKGSWFTFGPHHVRNHVDSSSQHQRLRRTLIKQKIPTKNERT